ncbi:MAG: YeeE/YedE family protein [Alphaproteobacteria bacterium]|nr:YeeE/YedE family protein [Alphaproteobacteria bacterium]
MTDFTPWAGAEGGALIGLAAVILMAGAGRIMGATGIVRGLMTTQFDEAFSWRLVFIVGLLIGTAWTALFTGITHSISFVPNNWVIALGGILVGAGTTLGNGCTSGHGICGISRLSKRSITATCVFMAVAIITVYVVRHIVGII